MLVALGQGTVRVTAVNQAGQAEGIRPGMTLSDARALYPGLAAAEAEPAADARDLERLAAWCGRYSPWVAVDGLDGITLDITGCAHLFGGEAAMLDEMLARLAGFGLGVRGAIADTIGGAWALARFGDGRDIAAPGSVRGRLAPLPVAGLRFPADLVDGLEQLGLRRIGDLYPLPRGSLAMRFGDLPGRRLDQALGRADEPLSPRQPVAAYRVELRWPEPLGRLEDIAAASEQLLARLAERLESEQAGARRLVLSLYRVDGEVAELRIGTRRPSRDPAHLQRLLAEHFDRLDLGFGVEVMALAAPVTEALAPRQAGLATAVADGGGEVLARLIDRLQNRVGPDHVVQLVPVDSHQPDRVVALVPAPPPAAAWQVGWQAEQPRPIRLLPCPEPIEVVAPLPDHAPVQFRWRKVTHRVARAEGPERIAPDWWREAGRTRDYYRVEDQAGRRFWLYRDGLYDEARSPGWYLHGLFA